MENTVNITEASVYVGTYNKYNNGSLFGKWLELSDYTNRGEFYEACEALHNDEEDPEYMFQDYENIPGSLINESWISEKLFQVIQLASDLDEARREAFFIWCHNGHHDLSTEDMEVLISRFEGEYIGEYGDEEGFAREIIEQRDDLSAFVRQYFDYEMYARDLFISEYWFDGGHVFYNR